MDWDIPLIGKLLYLTIDFQNSQMGDKSSSRPICPYTSGRFG